MFFSNHISELAFSENKEDIAGSGALERVSFDKNGVTFEHNSDKLFNLLEHIKLDRKFEWWTFWDQHELDQCALLEWICKWVCVLHDNW